MAATDRELEKFLRERKKAYDKGNLKEVSQICNNIGYLYTQKGDHKKALEYHREELSLSEGLNDALGEAIGHRKVGECLADLCQFNKALKEQEKYLNIVESLNKTEEIQRAYVTIGRIWYMRYKSEYKVGEGERKKSITKYLDKSHQAFQYSLEQCQQLMGVVNKKDLADMRAGVYLNLGLVAEERGDMETAERHFQKTTELSKECNNHSLTWQSLYNLSELLINARLSNRALIVLEESLKYAELGKNKSHRASSLLQIAMVHIHLVDFQMAKKYLKSSLKLNAWTNEDYQSVVMKYKIICKALSILSETVSCSVDQRIILYDKLGDMCCYRELEFYNAAIKYYKLELQLAEDHGYEMTQLAKICFSIAETYKDNEQYKEAIEYYQKELFMWQGHPAEEATTWANIARVHEATNQVQEALEAYSAAIHHASCSYNELGDVYQSLISFCESQPSLVKEATQYSLEYEQLLKDHPEIDSSNQSIKLEKSQEVTPLSSQELREELVLSSSESEDDEETVGLTDYAQTTRQLRGVAVRKKAKHSVRNEKGETPLHVAAINGNLTRIQQLLADGADVNARDYCGWTPLHEACNHGNQTIVECLLNHSANINDGGGAHCNNTTPLMDAATNGHVGVVTLLIDRGANLSIKNDKGETALSLVDNYITSTDSYDEDYYSIRNQLIQAMRKQGLHELINEKRREREKREKGQRIISSSPETPVAIVHPLPRNEINEEEAVALISVESDDELLTDDWLINDINPPPHKKHKPKTSGCGQTSNSTTISKIPSECGQGSLKRRGQGRLTKRKSNSVIIEEEEEWNNNDINTDNYSSPTQSDAPPIRSYLPPTQSHLPSTHSSIPLTQSYPPPTQSYAPLTQSYAPPTQSILRIKVRLNSDLYFIPCPLQQVDDTYTNIEWLMNTASERCYKQHGRRPVLSLTTSEGALLCLTDNLCEVLQDGEEVVGVVKHWETPPLHEHYQSVCNDFKTDMHPKILQLFQSANSPNLNFTNFELFSSHFSSLSHTLLAHQNLTSLNISGNYLTDACVTHLIELLTKCVSLYHLDLSCIGLTEHGLQSLAQSLTTPTGVTTTNNAYNDSQGQLSLKTLKLNHNDFGSYCGSSLSLLLSHTPSLSSLQLNDTGLTAYTMETHTGLIGSLRQCKFLQEVSVDFNSELNEGLSVLGSLKLMSLSATSVLSSFMTTLKLCDSLLYLNLSCCYLGSNNLSSLSSLTLLQSLNLSGNTLTNEKEIQALTKSISMMKDLKKLDLSGNRYIGTNENNDNYLSTILNSCKHTSLEHLLIMDCDLSSPLLTNFISALPKLNRLDIRANDLLLIEDKMRLKAIITTIVL